jgi:hypothetical protein
MGLLWQKNIFFPIFFRKRFLLGLQWFQIYYFHIDPMTLTFGQNGAHHRINNNWTILANITVYVEHTIPFDQTTIGSPHFRYSIVDIVN